jgi:hypothetical protein
MKKNEIELSKFCWNKFGEIHAKIEYFQKLYTILDNLNEFLSDFQRNYNSLKFDALLNPVVDDQFNELMKNINKGFKIFLDVNSVLIQNLLKDFQEINNIIKTENINYEKVLSEQKKYKDKKEKMEKSKNHYFEKMRVIEDSMKEKIIQKKQKITIDSKKMNQAIKDFNEYKYNLDELNKVRENFNNAQKILLEENYKEFFKSEAILFDLTRKNFSIVQKSNFDFSSATYDKYKTKKETKKEKSENEMKFITNEINNYKSLETPEDRINIVDYHLNHKQYVSDQNSSPEDIVKAYQISENLVKNFRKYIKENYPDIGLQIQEAYLDIPDIFYQFFGLKVALTDELKNELLKLLKEDISLYRQLLIELGRLRADGKLFSSKDHIEFISILLLEILKICEKKLDLKAAKDCILLSQTYYILNEKNNEKIYAFEKIRKNKWIRSAKFWRDFLELYINLEFNKFEEMYNLDVKLKDNPELSKKTKSKVTEVMFSCLVPYTNNMVELNVDKRIILKLLDEILEKYKYMDDVSKLSLMKFISNNPEDIEKMRKEIKDNPNIENEIEKKIEDEKIDDNSNSEAPKNEININEENTKEE